MTLKTSMRSGPEGAGSRRGWVALLGLVLLCAGARPSPAGPLRVVATTPDLGSLAREVGGEEVSVEVLTKGPQDPHFIEPRPSFIRTLHDADLFVQVGMDLEIGWAPSLLRSARNPDIQPGARGFVDASVAILPMEVPTGPVDRSMGDVHPFGNPHYLTDPLSGLRVARLLRDELAELRPGSAAHFRERYDGFAKRLAEALVGAELASRREPEEIARLLEQGGVERLLEAERREAGGREASEAGAAGAGTERSRAEPGGAERLGGWLGAVYPHRGTEAVQDHRIWPYFARRFGLEIVSELEPRPGIAPTTRQLAKVVETMRSRDVPLILSTAYYDVRHARWVAERTGAEIVPLAHQPGAREGAPDYLSTVDYNVRQVLAAR